MTAGHNCAEPPLVLPLVRGWSGPVLLLSVHSAGLWLLTRFSYPPGLLASLVGLLGLSLLYQALTLWRRRYWRLTLDGDNWLLDAGVGAPRAVNCRVAYVCPWLVVLWVGDSARPLHLPLFAQGLPGDSWRRLHVACRSHLRGG